MSIARDFSTRCVCVYARICLRVFRYMCMSAAYFCVYESVSCAVCIDVYMSVYVYMCIYALGVHMFI